MTPKQKRKIKQAIELMKEAMVDEQEPEHCTRPEVEEIQTREGKPKKWVAVPGFFGQAKSGKDATHFVR